SFFFSSRRRHTRFDCDWSSDVCSSDLWRVPAYLRVRAHRALDLRLGRRRSAGDPGKRGDVQLGHLGEINEVDMVDRVAVADAVLGPQILMLPVVILDGDADPRGRIAELEERNVV